MGGCVVAEVDAPAHQGDRLTSRATLGPHVGCTPLEQQVLELATGGSTARSTGEREEVLFVLSGRGDLRLDGAEHALEPESGAYLAPGETYELRNPGREPLRLVAVSIPDPAPPGAATGERAVVRRLADQDAQAATTQREFRIVADPASGLRSATHFVGYIPTTRAPDHMHHYDEVIYVLDGEGVMRMNGEATPLRGGSCIHLPARTVHCLENTGPDVMKVVGVFRPAGSPAAAYYPDGTPAYAGTPPE
ncbi:cupin domain-containing protein [Candidatus Solirubrobacter pratensis]|uniref:cupin domain-containing protein n=1 Tax=Candidatus Solirubrobacter pratensis TaxID=1298857 RepID=UPI00041D2E5B|nr:cupin domain-containing protein [Candidatus Solirubrobacter pratensis]